MTVSPSSADRLMFQNIFEIHLQKNLPFCRRRLGQYLKSWTCYGGAMRSSEGFNHPTLRRDVLP